MNESEENINKEVELTEEVDETSSELLDFIDLVNCIVFYYTSAAETDDIDPADAWKQKAGLIKKAIPEEVDDLVKRAFMKKLTDHI